DVVGVERHPLPHRVDQLPGGTTAEVTVVEPPDPVEIADGARRALGDRDDREVGQDVADRPVDALCPLLPPGGDRLGDAPGPSPEASGLLDAPPRVLRRGAFGVAAPQLIALVERPLEPAAGRQLL